MDLVRRVVLLLAIVANHAGGLMLLRKGEAA
jgi:hypothetical protein